MSNHEADAIGEATQAELEAYAASASAETAGARGAEAPNRMDRARARLYRAAVAYAKAVEPIGHPSFDTDMAACEELEHAALEFAWRDSHRAKRDGRDVSADRNITPGGNDGE